MRDYDPVLSFGEETAARYDAENVRGDEAATVDFLARWARGGSVLEFAIGTGRIGLPLAGRGLSVDGIELSPAMAARLTEKLGGERVGVTIGDFATTRLPERYRLVYVVYNTLFNLLTQDQQVTAFQNAADHLTEDGVFVVEAFVPAFLHRLTNDQYVEAEAVGIGQVRLDVARHDPVAQMLYENHVTLSSQGVRLGPIVTRYAWPSELDLMARLAGLRLEERWGGWAGEPFNGDSRRHVSVYGR